ncbi:hypothetical protein K458DRAFT_389089 [Lentithecium fluviatile CBS 122367]|uniref:Uncharacterized protein n=1 Tax=Lentithecium fluviatile CBS 122367 TaxID=1168545 RepID=A0A6G1J2J4_9PLEO|nr:hypothetical protein K458DRAFT_389089 [Lentithecium fluviatile CBS 122367]
MNSTAGFPWLPPDIYSLEFTNCTLAGEWAAVYWRSETDYPLFALVDLVRNGLSPWLTRNNLTPPTDGDVMKWIMDYGIILDDYTGPWPLWYLINEYAATSCLDEVCPRIGWQGNSDLAGRGMLVNYILQAALAMLYWTALSLDQMSWISRYLRTSEATKRILTALQHSTRVFLDGAVIFTSAMLLAAAFTFTQAVSDSTVPLPLYSALITAYLSLYSIIPTSLIYLVASAKLRRTRARIIIWGFMAFLAALVASLWFALMNAPGFWTSGKFSEEKAFKDPEHQYIFDFFCMNQGEFNGFKKAFYSLLGVIGNLFISALAKAFLNPDYQNWSPKVAQRIRQTLQYFRIVTNLSCCLSTWAFLGIYLRYRRVLFGNRAGITNKEKDFSFGQVLALSTWIPVIIEFAYIYCKGPREALTGKIMAPFYVVSSKDTEDLQFEKEHRHELLRVTEEQGE